MLPRRLHGFIQHFSRLGRDQSGAVLVMFAIFGSVLLALTAGSIEIYRRNAAIQELQNAVDAASLYGKKEQVSKRTTMTALAARIYGANAAKQMFEQSISNSKLLEASTAATYTWNADGSLTVATTPSYNSVFGSVLPTSFRQVSVRATAAFANSIPTEVAMVLDSTMSMFNKDGRPQTRFTLMRDAAKRFTHELFNAAQTAGDVNLVRMSVVPWATSVNIRGGAPAAADYTGDAPIVSIPDWGSRLPVATPLGRGMVNNTSSANFQPVQWRGCISGDLENPTSYSDASQASWNALAVKSAPIYRITVAEGPGISQPSTSCTCTNSVSVPCGPVVGTQGFNNLIQRAIPQLRNARFAIDPGLRDSGSVETERAQCTSCTAQTCTTSTVIAPDCSTATSNYTLRYCYYYGANGRRNSYNPSSFACTGQWDGCYLSGSGPTEDLTAPACVADPNEPGAINNTIAWCPQYSVANKVWDSAKEIAGPNLNCPAPMLGLSGNRSQVIEYLDRMFPVPGGTHADVGLRWGLRTLAPTNGWPAFFGVTRTPDPWAGSAQKVLILITDGENEQAVDFAGYWGCSNTDSDHDCSASPDAATLDTRMQGWCTAIRTTYQTTIYAVAVNFTNAAAVTKLQTCAGNPSNVFSVDAAGLNNVLAGIAARVMAMRLVQ